MDWKRAIEQERTALMRLVALLGALAGLAECAAARSPAMRGLVLWVLRRAERAARDFVAGGQDAPIALMPPAGCRPADAHRLAASFRALARELAQQIERQAKLLLAACGGGGAEKRPPLFGRMAGGVAISVLAAFAWPLPHPAPDTS